MTAQKVKVHLTGGDQGGWALDQDLITTRASLSALNDLVELVPLEESEVVHSVWEEPLLAVPKPRLAGKRIVCHVCNDVCRTFEHAFMLGVMRTIGLWVAISRKAERDLESLKLRTVYTPYTLDLSVFRRRTGPVRNTTARAAAGIPANAYVIGNFMRDSLGSNLMLPKDQKAPEVFVEIVRRLNARGLPVHVLLCGPRRHWMRGALAAAGIPFTFIGRITDADDYGENVLPQGRIAELYGLMDLCMLTSRWEGGPRAVLEAAATGTKVICTRVGLAPDVLEPQCIFDAPDQAVQIVANDIEHSVLDRTVEIQYERFARDFTPRANEARFRAMYEAIREIPVFQPEPIPARRPIGRIRRIAGLVTGKLGFAPYISARPALTIGMWHEFHKPPYGGGNQFMMALKAELRRRRVRVVTNRMSPWVDVHLCNSAWFDVGKFRAAARRRKIRVVQRVDGPIAIYRGSTWEEDNKIYELNKEFASATVFQSAWCFQRMIGLGFQPVNPLIIKNAVDGRIFHGKDRIRFDGNRKIRLISNAWSPNPRKGVPFYKSLEDILDWNRFEYTFVGTAKETFTHIRHIPPVPSCELADILRQHDIYIMASQGEAYSNALIEALACGLPALFLADGGNSEAVGMGGLPFKERDDALESLNRLVDQYELLQSAIHVESIESVANRYLALAEKVMNV